MTWEKATRKTTKNVISGLKTIHQGKTFEGILLRMGQRLVEKNISCYNADCGSLPARIMVPYARMENAYEADS